MGCKILFHREFCSIQEERSFGAPR
jgi:hypothetical protein